MASLTPREFNLLRLLIRVTSREHRRGFSEVNPSMLPYSSLEIMEGRSSKNPSGEIIFSPGFERRLNQVLSRYMWKNLVELGGWKKRPYFSSEGWKLSRIFELEEFPREFSRFSLGFWTWMIETYYLEFPDEEEAQKNRSMITPKGSEDRILNLCFIKDLLMNRQKFLWKQVPQSFRQAGLCTYLLSSEQLEFLPNPKQLSTMERLFLESLSDLIPETFRYQCKELQKITFENWESTLEKIERKLSGLYRETMESGGFSFLEHYLGIGRVILEEEFLKQFQILPYRVSEERRAQTQLLVEEFFGGYLQRVEGIRSKLNSYSFVDPEYEISRWGLEVMEQQYRPIEKDLKAQWNSL